MQRVLAEPDVSVAINVATTAAAKEVKEFKDMTLNLKVKPRKGEEMTD